MLICLLQRLLLTLFVLVLQTLCIAQVRTFQWSDGVCEHEKAITTGRNIPHISWSRPGGYGRT